MAPAAAQPTFGPKTIAGRARALANLRRGGGPGRKRGIPNAATLEIKALASRLLIEDEEWIESARRRMIAGEAPHLETFFLSHKYGRPKDVDQAPDKPPIVFVSQYGPPGSYDPLARPAVAPMKAEVTSPQRSLPSGAPAVLPHGATGAGHDGGALGTNDDDEEELVVVRA
jgi:hypothetical protein